MVYEARRGGAGDDAMPDNDGAAAVVRIQGAARVLWVGARRQPQPLLDLLLADGGHVERLEGRALVATAAELAGYDLVVLDGVAAEEVADHQVEGLATYLDNGGGLLVVGGPGAFGSGGYAGSPLDRLLPVTSDLRRSGGRMAVVLLVDKSGSMGGREEGWERLLLAKDTLRAIVGSLKRKDDRVGIIGFDTRPVVMMPLTPVAQVDFEGVDTGAVQAAGGTDPTPALQAAGLELEATAAPLRQILVITDGRFAGEGVEAEVRRLAARGVGLSAIGVGQRAEMGRLERLATLGRGGVSQVHDARRLPKVVLRELLKASGGLVRPGPVPVHPGSELGELHPDLPLPAPPLDAINRTLAREGTARWLQSDTGDPILTAWRRGAGTVATMCSRPGGWASRWASWSGAPPLYRALLAVLARRTHRPWSAALVRRGVQLEATLEAFTPDGEPMSARRARAELATPDEERRAVPLAEESPGVYRGSAAVGRPGRYRATFRMDGTLVAEAELVVSRPPELERTGNDLELLSSLAAASGGALWHAGTDLPMMGASQPVPRRRLRPWLATAAALAFMAYLGLLAQAARLARRSR